MSGDGGWDPQGLKRVLSEPNTFSSGGRGVRYPLSPPFSPRKTCG